MKRLALFAIMLAGCSSPSPKFSAGYVGSIQVEGMNMAVFQSEEAAQVIRSGAHNNASPSSQKNAMIQAATKLTGCEYVEGSSAGDTAILTIEIEC